MAKKKKRKEVKKDTNALIEIKGILIILITIIGLCNFEPLSKLINGFSGFLFGTLWAVFLVLIGLVGSYMIVKRQKFDFLTSKLIKLK